MTTPQQHPPAGAAAIDDGDDPDLEQIQATIEKTRAELGETVEALTTKLDVKSRTQARLTDLQNQAIGRLHTAQARASQLTRSAQRFATDEHGKPKPAALAAAAGAAAVLTAVFAAAEWRSRRGTVPVLAWVRRR